MEKHMINCTGAMEGIVNSVLRYEHVNGSRKTFPKDNLFKRLVVGYATQEMTRIMQNTPFHLEHASIVDKVIKRLIDEGYLQDSNSQHLAV